MAHIFISYSHADTQFKDELVAALQAIYLDRHQFWHEKKKDATDTVRPESIERVGPCDVFMYLLSNEAVASKQCRAEFREALRLGKRILAVQVRDQNKITGKVSDIEYVDMRDSLDDRQAFERFVQVFNKTIEQLPKQKVRPLSPKPAPQPESSSVQGRSGGAPDDSNPEGEKRKSMPPAAPRIWWKDPMIVGAIMGVTAVLVVGLTLLSRPVAPPQSIASTYEAVHSAQLLTATATPIVVPLNTTTPDIFMTAQKVLQQQTADASTATAVVEGVLRQTQSAQETQVAAAWTVTATPNTTQTLSAIFTEWAQETVTEESYRATLTAQAWTVTPSPSQIPTLVASQTPVAPIQTIAPIIVTGSPDLSPEEKMAFTPVTQNTAWLVVERLMDGEPMMLVPAGCFMMGASDSDVDEQPVTSQCFDRPFWIDKFEVSNRQFGVFDGMAQAPMNGREWEQPRDNITWAEAQNFCIRRGGRLPTEREWEYAARGPSNLIYPWGNDWDQKNIVWIGSHTARVGSRPRGASWVGSLDMAGNISEWVSSLYQPYPYQIQDGREGSGNPGDHHVRRGQALSFTGDGDFRSANRLDSDLPYGADIGFRCVRSIQ